MAVFTLVGINNGSMMTEHYKIRNAGRFENGVCDKYGIKLADWPDTETFVQEQEADGFPVYVLKGDESDEWDYPLRVLRTCPIEARFAANPANPTAQHVTTIDETEVTDVRVIYAGGNSEVARLVGFEPSNLENGGVIVLKVLIERTSDLNEIRWTYLNLDSVARVELLPSH